jgi:GNAT superfamily N-acetyltransferase
VGALTPACPERSVVNGVVAEPDAVTPELLVELAAEYEAGGVRAWTVWVHDLDGDGPVAALQAAGHVLDASPLAMWADLVQMDLGADPEGLEIVEDPDALGPLNDLAYGLPPDGLMSPGLAGFGRDPRVQVAVARVDGEPVACAGGLDHGADCEVTFVATHPDHRGRGLASALMRRVLRDARERGRLTTTLEATQLGAPVYERLGYRRFGAWHMFERRDG